MRRLVLLCVSLLLAGPAMAQPAADAPVLTLDDAVRLALQHNRLIHNAELELGRAGDRLEAARTRRYPAFQFGLVGAYVPIPIDLQFAPGVFGTFPGIGPVPATDTTISTDPGFTFGLAARIVQPLSQLYRIGSTIEALEAGRAVSREDLRARRQAAAADVRRVYYAVLQGQSALAAAQEQVTALVELERVVERRLAEEAVLLADHLEVQARLARARHHVASLRNQLASRKERLNSFLGRELGTPFRAASVPEASPVETGFDVAEARALAQRPDVRRARHQLVQLEADLRAKRSELIPDLSLVGSYVMPITSDVLPREIAWVGLELTWDVFDWGRKRREADEKAKAMAQVRNLASEAETQVVLDVRSQARQLEEARELVGVAELARRAARERLRVVANRYREQAATLREVLDAQAALAQADDQHQQALLAVWVARAEFERALGED
jgi:outer membrane protein TolC